MWTAGIGTGRCGTKSLAELLGLPHEESPPQPFGDLERREDRAYGRLLEHIEGTRGGVAYWLGWAAGRLLREEEGVRVIAMMRPADPFVRSFLEVLGPEVLRKGKTKTKRSFPSHPCLSPRRAAYRYWTEYNSLVLSLKARHPDRVLLASTAQLSTGEGRREILQHAHDPTP